MTVFDAFYDVSRHAVEMLQERTNIENDKATELCWKLCKDGKVVLQTDKHRYVRHGKLFFPCKNIGENRWKIKTVLIYDSMVKYRFQNIVNKYDGNN